MFLFTSAVFASGLDSALPRLSDYSFFNRPLKELSPTPAVIPYKLATPLFTDYAFKLRFLVLPEGEKITFLHDEKFAFPVGTIFIKNFYYPADFRYPHKDWNIIETRLLIHSTDGWTGLPYIWNKEQTDATLEIAGGRQHISWINENGKRESIHYQVPNFNDCKSCHVYEGVIQPIGPKPRLLNCDYAYESGEMNQLLKWKELHLLMDIPTPTQVSTTADWSNTKEPIDKRARAYLDVNCAHCHNPKGPANTSGLFLEYTQSNPRQIGIYKPPVAAGRGSGPHQFNIVPGEPDASIFIYRMESNDPGIMMPELGRKMVHREGVELIREWITALPKD